MPQRADDLLVDLDTIPPLDCSRPFLEVARKAFARYETEKGGPADFAYFLSNDAFLWRRLKTELCGSDDLTRGYLDQYTHKKGIVKTRGLLQARTLCEIVKAYPEVAESVLCEFKNLKINGIEFPQINPVIPSIVYFEEAFGFDPNNTYVPASTLRERWPRLLFESTIYPTPDKWIGSRRLFKLSRVLGIESENFPFSKKSLNEIECYNPYPLAETLLNEKGMNIGRRIVDEREQRFAAFFGRDETGTENSIDIGLVIDASIDSAHSKDWRKDRPDLPEAKRALLPPPGSFRTRALPFVIFLLFLIILIIGFVVNG